MKNSYLIIFLFSLGFAGSLLVSSCNKEEAPVTRVVTPVFPAPPPASFVEEFDSAGTLSGKGWVFKNNSFPIGSTGWRQGRYESAALVQYKFLAPVSFLGFPAYSAKRTPNDFISCDAAASTDASTNTSDISAWLISPPLPLKNGDQIIFYSRAAFDAAYPVYTRDRMQVRANFSDASANVGSSPTSVGNFTTVLLDINQGYMDNDPSGYPQDWTKYTITLSGVPGGSVTSGRFAFRYLATDAGLFGGLQGTNYPSIVGVDSLAFVHN